MRRLTGAEVVMELNETQDLFLGVSYIPYFFFYP